MKQQFHTHVFVENMVVDPVAVARQYCQQRIDEFASRKELDIGFLIAESIMRTPADERVATWRAVDGWLAVEWEHTVARDAREFIAYDFRLA